MLLVLIQTGYLHHKLHFGRHIDSRLVDCCAQTFRCRASVELCVVGDLQKHADKCHTWHVPHLITRMRCEQFWQHIHGSQTASCHAHERYQNEPIFEKDSVAIRMALGGGYVIYTYSINLHLQTVWGTTISQLTLYITDHVITHICY